MSQYTNQHTNNSSRRAGQGTNAEEDNDRGRLTTEQLSRERWIPHPFHLGTYIKQHGPTWHAIHNYIVSQPSSKINHLSTSATFYNKGLMVGTYIPNSSEVYF